MPPICPPTAADRHNDISVSKQKVSCAVLSLQAAEAKLGIGCLSFVRDTTRRPDEPTNRLSLVLQLASEPAKDVPPLSHVYVVHGADIGVCK